MTLVFIKLGGSVITDKTKPYTARIEVIKKIAKEIHEVRKEDRRKNKIKLIVGHGGGSFPHFSAAKYKTHLGLVNEKSLRGLAIVHMDAAKINEIIIKELINAGENVMSVQPSAAAIAKNGKIIKWDIAPIKEMLKHDLIPVPYGDVCLDIKQGCCIISTEEIFSFLAKKLKPKKIIMVGEVDGVYADGKIVREINNHNFNKIKKYLLGSRGTDVTGGMFHKIKKALEIAKHNIPTYIINGQKKDSLKRAILFDDYGTKIC